LNEPTFESGKVERIAAAIRDGSFKVNADVIADKLIANAQELLGRAKN
jgi:negative regulator of flagellin synthesis FlgM